MLPSFEEVTLLFQAARSIEALLAVWQGVVEQLGFAAFAYGAGTAFFARSAAVVVEETRLDRYLTASGSSAARPPDWIVAPAPGRVATYVYETGAGGQGGAAPIANGLATPLRGPGPAAGVMYLGSSLGRREFAELDHAVRPHVALLSAMFHERAQQLLRPAPRRDRLSRRERECLRWVADGKTSWEIAAILDVSVATVDNTVASARRRLGVATRAQAVAAALGAGLIEP